MQKKVFFFSCEMKIFFLIFWGVIFWGFFFQKRTIDFSAQNSFFLVFIFGKGEISKKTTSGKGREREERKEK